MLIHAVCCAENVVWKYGYFKFVVNKFVDGLIPGIFRSSDIC